MVKLLFYRVSIFGILELLTLVAYLQRLLGLKLHCFFFFFLISNRNFLKSAKGTTQVHKKCIQEKHLSSEVYTRKTPN
jgi:hypothetical protein